MEVIGRRLVLVLALGVFPGCANATQRGKVLYSEGRLIEAAEVFEHGEERLVSLSGQERVRYGLYRGATLLKLGDLDGAARWLYFAQQAENQSPGSIEASDRLTLRLAFKDLDRRRSQVKSNIDPLKGAVARANGGQMPRGPDVVEPVDSSTPALAPTPVPLPPNLPEPRR